jgi:hypothetical protein
MPVLAGRLGADGVFAGELAVWLVQVLKSWLQARPRPL